MGSRLYFKFKNDLNIISLIGSWIGFPPGVDYLYAPITCWCSENLVKSKFVPDYYFNKKIKHV